MDADRPAGDPTRSVRASGHPGFLTPHGRQGLAVALIGYAAGLILSSLFASIAIGAGNYHLSGSADQPLPVTVAELVGLWIGLLGAAIWWSQRYGSKNLGVDLGLRVAAWWDVPLGVAVGLASQYGLTEMYQPFRHIDHNISRQLGQPTQKLVGTSHSSPSVVLLLLFLALGAPMVEELFFRGLLLRSLTDLTNPAVAIVVSGLLFGLAHFEALQFAGLAAFGMVLAFLAWRLRRLGPSICAHMSFNTVAVLSIVHLH